MLPLAIMSSAAILMSTQCLDLADYIIGILMWNINPLRAHIEFYKLADQDLLERLQQTIQSEATLCYTSHTLL